MAETNDLNAHMRSLRPTWNSIKMLNGRRYGGRYPFESNQAYAIPRDKWGSVYTKGQDANQTMIDLIQWYVNDHFNFQLPRILELERYYAGDENIHYWNSGKSHKQADERITSGYPGYITDIHTGYELANPLTYGYDNPQSDADTGEKLLNQLTLFNRANSEPYHEMMMFKNACNTGRAYELIYCAKDDSEPQMTAVDPNQAFVVWSTDVKPTELFGVRYYAVNVADDSYYLVEVYTEYDTYYFKADKTPNNGWTLDKRVNHSFGHVPLLEYRLNDERMGIWESQIDNIDAYDIAKSEMANTQEDFSNSKLVISGKIRRNKREPQTDPNGKPLFVDNVTNAITYEFKDKNGKENKQAMQPLVNTLANTLFLTPYMYQDANGNKQFNQTSAEYLTKEANAADWKTYIDEIKQRILQGSNTPDLSDESFAQDQTGEALSYKLWGTDQNQAAMHEVFKSSITRRLQLLAVQWLNTDKTSIGNSDYQNVTISFTPNLPKNDAKQVDLVSSALGTGAISDDTGRDMLEGVTGVPASMEKGRIDKQKQEAAKETGGAFQQSLADFQKQKKLGGGGNDSDNTADKPS